MAVPKDANAFYLTRTFDESSVQILVDYIDAQMHKVSGIPDMTDINFAANASGVAIKYKLMALNNLAQSFISQFERGFARRCKLYSYALFGKDGADIDGMRITFRFNLPADNSYDAQTMEVYRRNNALSTRTMIENCPYVDDPDEEERRISEETAASDARQREAETDYLQTEGQGILGEEPTEDEDGQEDARADRGGAGVSASHPILGGQARTRIQARFKGSLRRDDEDPVDLRGQGRVRQRIGGVRLPEVVHRTAGQGGAHRVRHDPPRARQDPMAHPAVLGGL